jgi:putative PIN family toxin of toxin-antitoxin system
MRALLDANIYISFLLTRNPASPPHRVVDAALDGAYDLLISAGVIDEVRRNTTTKPYLAERITPPEVERLVRNLLIIAESFPDLDVPYPKIGNDRKDDYLFAHAVLGEADYLVSGDGGVRGIERIGGVHIVTPAEFVELLDAAAPQ